MDERALTELLECSVCLEQLDATSKVLQCQHTFCRRCLEEIVATKNELRCPECRMLVEMRVDELPSNILLIRLLEGLKNCKAGITGQSSSANSSPSHTQPSSPASATGGIRTSPIHKIVNTSQPSAKALYNYEAKEHGDLTFKKGDVILLRRQVDENWYHGELSGQHGFFPATYVQVLTPLPQEIPKCKALYDFVISDKNEKDCLTFQKDEVLTVIRRVDDNWAEGKLGDRIGIFPISFVEMNDSAKWLINNQTQINARPNAVATPTVASSSGQSPLANSTNNNDPPGGGTGSGGGSSGGSSPPSGGSGGGGSGGGGGGGGLALSVLSNPTVAAVQRVAGQKRHSLTCISSHKVAPAATTAHHRHSMELSSGNLALVPLVTVSSTLSSTSSTSLTTTTTAGMASSNVLAPTPKHHSCQLVAAGSSSHEANNTTSSGHMGPASLILYVALYNYKPQKDDEVELRKGDYYTVSEKCQDGWFKGTCLRTGNFGVFPGNYVQLVKISSKQTSSSVNRGAAPGAVAVGAIAGSSSVAVSSSSSSSSAAAAAAGLSSSSPSRQSQVAKVQQHVTVSRAHSFPKTSPLASMDYQVRQGGQSGTRTATNTPTHVPRPGSCVSGGLTPTRTITNPAHAPSRAAAAAAAAGVQRSSAASTPCSSAHTSPAHAQTRTQGSPLANGAASIISSSSSSSPSNGEAIRKSHHHHHGSHGHSRGSGGTNGSPRVSRKSERSKHSSSSSSADRTSKHASVSAPSSHRSHSADVPPHAPARTPHSAVVASIPAHSMAANACLTPPNVVVGAVGGDPPPPPPPAPREKEKEKKKDKDRLGLMKRLTKSKKSKSPPPEQPPDGSSPSEVASAHQRTGSCPANSVEGATAGVTPAHRKTASLDSTSGNKAPRTKPLLRERCRCIVPYPPQSNIELELKVGDIVFVHRKRDDGWYKGTLQRTGKTGLFPGSFVERF